MLGLVKALLTAALLMACRPDQGCGQVQHKQRELDKGVNSM